MQDAIVIHQPAGPARQLVLLFHGVGASPGDLVPLGEAVAQHRAQARVVSVRSPDPSDIGSGWQWFSVRGVDELSRPARVAAAMPRFVETVRHWQDDTGLGAAGTTLIGFSQGAIMALESTQQPPALASTVIAIAGRFAEPPRLAPQGTAVRLMHGDRDAVMPCALSHQALAQLLALGATATLDVFAQLGHGVDARVVERVVDRLPPPLGAAG